MIMRCPGLILRWLHELAQAVILDPPDMLIGGPHDPYLERWFVIPRNPIFNIYLHIFRRDDEDRVLHDHPWPSCSIILTQGYREHFPGGGIAWRAPGQIVFRRARAAHRISIVSAYAGGRAAFPMSLFITGPRIRRWGFHCPKGWVHWKDFVDPTDRGAVGPGCGEP